MSTLSPTDTIGSHAIELTVFNYCPSGCLPSRCLPKIFHRPSRCHGLCAHLRLFEIWSHLNLVRALPVENFSTYRVLSTLRAVCFYLPFVFRSFRSFKRFISSGWGDKDSLLETREKNSNTTQASGIK